MAWPGQLAFHQAGLEGILDRHRGPTLEFPAYEQWSDPQGLCIKAWISARVGGDQTGPTRAPIDGLPANHLRRQFPAGANLSNSARC